MLALTDVAVGAGRGTSMQRVHLPPPLQCMQWVHAVDHAYGLETLLKLQLVEVLSLGMPEAELQQVTRLWELQPNLIGEDLERVDALADALRVLELGAGLGICEGGGVGAGATLLTPIVTPIVTAVIAVVAPVVDSLPLHL